MADPIITAAKAEATQLANRATGVAQGWLRRNVWGVLAVAVVAVLAAAAALHWGTAPGLSR
jgi:anti-sigma-K factor RskA